MRIAKKAVVAILASTWVCQSFAGYQVTVKSDADAGAKGKKGQNHNVVQMTTDSSNARIDFIEGQTQGAEKGSYLLTQDGGKTFTMVLPKDKTYMKWDMDSMMNMAGAVGNMMQIKITDPKIEKLRDEAGPDILGYPTRHYKFHSTYRMSMTVMGFKNETTISKDEEVWTTTKLDLAALGAWAGQVPKTHNADFDKLIQAEKGKMKGMPLKMLSVETATDSSGKTSVSKNSMEVSEIKSVSAPASLFTVPAGYNEITLPITDGQDEAPAQGQAKTKKGGQPKLDFGALMKQAMEQNK
jgi:hypothetical protein